jgi:plastocyanin
MFFVLLLALVRADFDAGSLLLDGSTLVPTLPAAQVHTVDWKIPALPNHIFVNVGDSVVFTWEGLHGVVMLGDSNSYSTCAVNLGYYMAPSTFGGSYTWQATTPGDFYFACPVDNGAHCIAGMRLWITVSSPAMILTAISGSLDINWGPPACSMCGASCTTIYNFGGVCNANLNCVARKLIPPVCGTACPILSCGIAPTCLAPTFLFNPTDANGCPMCPMCTAAPCIGSGCLSSLRCCPQGGFACCRVC